ncbi:MAG: hypothetical protein C0483_25810 [Pirellula sp.]|nr:hypothetical protein [Pirellula sp.]
MAPFRTVNTVLIGFFLFAAAHYLIMWWFSRRERVMLLFSMTSLVGALVVAQISRVTGATTIAEYQAAFDARTTWGLIGTTLTGWMISSVTGVRAQRYLWCVTLLLGVAWFTNAFIYSLAGPVLSLDFVELPWGETAALGTRARRYWIGVPIYGIVLSVHCFGLYSGARLFRTDRAGGALVMAAVVAGFAASISGVAADLLKRKIPYFGGLSYAFWIVLVSVLLAREYRRRTEALAASEERYRTIIANQTEFVVRWLPDGTRTFVNESYCRYFGVTEEQCVGTSFLPLVAPEFRQAVRDKVLALSPENPVAIDEHLSFDAAGNLCWQEWRCRGVFDAQGRLLELVSTGRDVTERRVAEEILRRNEERYRLLTEQARLVLWEGDPESLLFTYVSESAAELIGEPPAKWYLPNFWAEHIHPDDRAEALESCQTSTARREDHRFEYRMLRADGSVIWVEDIVKVIVNPTAGTVSLRGLLIDITSRKAADEELRETRERFRSAFDSAAVGMAIVSIEGKFLKVNRAVCDMLGHTEHALLALNVQAISYPEDLEVELALVARALAGEITRFDLEKRYRHCDGRVVWGWLSVSLVRDAVGSPLYFVSQVQDLTERKRLEDQLRHSQKMEAIGRLAGGIAHDFNNIITVIATYGNLLEERLPPDDFNREAVRAVLDAAERATRLTRQILAFGRKQMLQPTLVDLNRVVLEAEPLLTRLLLNGARLRLVPASKPCTTKIDRDQLEQVLINLAVNARDAMPEGGELTIGVRIVPTDEIAGTQSEESGAGPYVELSVSDTGMGIDDETKNRIFEPFFTTKPAGKGTGLGLAVVYGIVRQSDGHIDVESRVRGGTTFRVRLPYTDGSPDAAPSRTPLRPPGLGTVLLVDDEEPIRTAVCAVLEEAGYKVITAGGGHEARDVVEGDEEIDIVLTDLVMPDFDGQEVAVMVRSLRPQLPVVIMSGRHDQLTKLPAGLADAALEKPFTTAELSEAVRRALRAASAGAGR